MADQVFSERPYRARDAVAFGDDGVKTVQDPITVGIGDNKCGQQLDRMASVTGDLAQQFMLFEKRDRNELAEQTVLAASRACHDALSLNDLGGPNSIPIINPLPRT